MSDRSIVSLRNTNIYQGKSLILSQVNFEVEKGEFVYLIGKTGTGKSSLLKSLYGDIYLKEGEGHVAGFDLKNLKWQNIPLLRRNLGIVFQDFRLLTDRNVYDNLEFVLKATGWKDKALMKEKIENVMENAFPVVAFDTAVEKLKTLINKENGAVLAKDDSGNFHIVTKYDVIQVLA